MFETDFEEPGDLRNLATTFVNPTGSMDNVRIHWAVGPLPIWQDGDESDDNTTSSYRKTEKNRNLNSYDKLLDHGNWKLDMYGMEAGCSKISQYHALTIMMRSNILPPIFNLPVLFMSLRSSGVLQF